MAPWVHQYMFPDGKMFPCCQSAEDLSVNLGSLSSGQTLRDIWNSEASKELRRNMLAGKHSKICEGCYKYQSLGKKSSRQEFNEKFAQNFDVVLDTNEDGSLDNFDLKSFDYRFSNICNLKCRSCSHHFSNKWFEESKIIGTASGSEKSIIYPVDHVGTLWEQIKPTLNGIEAIHFAGGEPLKMEEHYRILERLIEIGNTKVLLTYNTNFSDFKYKDKDVLELWRHFKHVSLLASLDASGKRGELMRKGLQWENVVENRKRLLKETPHVLFKLTPTVSIMNVLHLPDFYEEWLELKLIQAKEIIAYLLFEPYFYNIVNLPADYKRKVEDRYQAFFEKNKQRFSKSDSDYVNGQFAVVLNQMHQEVKEMPKGYYNGHDFKSYNAILDGTRNESFYEVFPELVGVV